MSLPLELDQPHRIWKSGASEQLSMSSRNSHKTILNCLVRTTPTLGNMNANHLGSGKWSSQQLTNVHHDQHSLVAESPPNKKVACMRKPFGGYKKTCHQRHPTSTFCQGPYFCYTFSGELQEQFPPMLLIYIVPTWFGCKWAIAVRNSR